LFFWDRVLSPICLELASNHNLPDLCLLSLQAWATSTWPQLVSERASSDKRVSLMSEFLFCCVTSPSHTSSGYKAVVVWQSQGGLTRDQTKEAADHGFRFQNCELNKPHLYYIIQHQVFCDSNVKNRL
jgi:hypothetical protein